MQIFQQMLLLLGCSVVFVALFQRLYLPPILGYIAVGMLAGPDGLGWIAHRENFHLLAEFGVVFLMFTIGLEFSLPKMFAMRRILLGLGGAQVLICTLIAYLGAVLIGLASAEAFVIASAFALSSTAVVIKQLAEQSELHHEHGRLAVSILIFQDLAAIVFLIIVPALGGSSDESIAISLFWTSVKGIMVFLFILAAGHWVMRPLFHEVARSRSSELFMLAALVVATAAAWLTQRLGLSLALGAFLSGVMLGETEYRHQLESDIRPFRDALLGLFFITVGMMVNLQDLPKYWYWILILVTLLIVLKTAIITLLARFAAKRSTENSFQTGLILAQSGEFGFAILTLASQDNIIKAEYNQIVLASIVLSMAICPILIKQNTRIGKKLFAKTKEEVPITNEQRIATADVAHENHVIICGFGRVGQTLASFLETEGLPSIALDLDTSLISEASLAGENLFYGNATRLEILEAAGFSNAKMIAITFSDTHSAIEILKIVREINQEIPILVRSKEGKNLEQLHEAGATAVVSETLESSLMMAAYMLQMMGSSPNKIFQEIWDRKRDRYKSLQEFFPGEFDFASIEEPEEEKRKLHTICILEDASVIGKKLAEIFTEELGCTIHSFTRRGVRSKEPDTQTTLEAGDVIVVSGLSSQIEEIEMILCGS